jgi:hypothetical protein
VCCAHFLAGPLSFFISTFIIISSMPLRHSCQITRSIRSFRLSFVSFPRRYAATRDPKLINHQHDLAVDAFTHLPFLFPFFLFFRRNTPSHPYLLLCRFHRAVILER